MKNTKGIFKSPSLLGKFSLGLDVNHTFNISNNDYEIIDVDDEHFGSDNKVPNFLSNEINFTWNEKFLMTFEWKVC